MTAVEGYTIRQQPLAALRGPSPLLRLASDERLIALTRSGQQAAFEALVARYQQRLLAFCRHMLRSREDAEDVLQEVFAAAFNAIMADSREINARPWLYRIARNRSLNHLRRTTAIGVDSMDAHFADAGQSTSEKAHGREEFRLLVDDIGHLPESQRSALVLREMDALSYEQIADVMDTTVPSVKSLLVRARIGLAEAAEARKLTCEEVRFELGETAEGLRSISAPVRRHVKQCDRCRAFRTQLRSNNRALAAVMPIGPLLLFKKTLLVKLGLAKLWAGGAGATGGAATAGAGGAGAAAASGSAIAVTGGGIAAGAVAIKAAVVVAAATLVAVGTTKIFHPAPAPHPRTSVAALSGSASSPVAPTAVTIHHHPLYAFTMNAHLRRVLAPLHVASLPAPYLRGLAPAGGASSTPGLAPTTPATIAPATAPVDTAPPATVPPVDTTPPATSTSATPSTQEVSTTTVFPSSTAGSGVIGSSGAVATTGTTGTTAPGETITTVTSLTGATGTSSTSTGSTAGAGSLTATGPTGSSGSVANGSTASASGATGPTGS
jgi:RNA polymerase sigma factor (sigma-70 family)